MIAPAERDVLVDIEGLAVGFKGANGDQPIVRDIDLRIHRGECVALVGESGSGKSITARSLIDLAGPGSVVSARRFDIAGQDARTFRAADWRRLRGTAVGLVMQDALVSLDPLRTVGQEVEETLRQHRVVDGRRAIHARAIGTLGKVGIPDPDSRALQYAHQLSGGLRQRALIASAIAADPVLIIADEPTTSLDVTVQAQVLQVLGQRVRDGAGLLLISHDLAVVAGIADRVIVMRGGRAVDSGTTREVLAHPRHPYTRQLIAAIPSAQSRGSRLASARFELDTATQTDHAAAVIIRDPLPPRKPADGAVVLEARGIGKSYLRTGPDGVRRPFVALDDIGLTLRAGEVLGIVGESGSGKSTCAKILLGLLEPDRGHVDLLGEAWSGIPERLRRARRHRLQYVPQDALSSFDPRYRVFDVIAENLPAAAGRRARRDLAARYLDQVGLDPRILDRYPRSLSGGQRQRVSIARALAAEPEIIVCDEPVSALDISIQAQVLDLIGELQSRLGTSLLFISHDLGVIRHIADRVMVLNGGRLVEEGEVERVFTRPREDYTQTLIRAVPNLEQAFA